MDVLVYIEVHTRGANLADFLIQKLNLLLVGLEEFKSNYLVMEELFIGTNCQFTKLNVILEHGDKTWPALQEIRKKKTNLKQIEKSTLNDDSLQLVGTSSFYDRLLSRKSEHIDNSTIKTEVNRLEDQENAIKSIQRSDRLTHALTTWFGIDCLIFCNNRPIALDDLVRGLVTVPGEIRDNIEIRPAKINTTQKYILLRRTIHFNSPISCYRFFDTFMCDVNVYSAHYGYECMGSHCMSALNGKNIITQLMVKSNGVVKTATISSQTFEVEPPWLSDQANTVGKISDDDEDLIHISTD